jgi:hypothetical protein
MVIVGMVGVAGMVAGVRMFRRSGVRPLEGPRPGSVPGLATGSGPGSATGSVPGWVTGSVPASATMSTSEGAGGRPRDVSILLWKMLRLVSVLADGPTAILACRRPPPGWPVAPAEDEGAEGLCDADRTIVLRLGGGDTGEQALALLEQWWRDGVWLRVRPSPVGGGIELADGDGLSALRAPVAAV